MRAEDKADTQLLTIIMDIDGTLCPVKGKEERYEELIPYAAMVEKLRAYHEAGAKIVLFTSRNMRTYSGNLGQINTHTAPVLLEWLRKWEIPYDEIIYGKPWPGKVGFYVDDRSVRPDEFMRYKPEELMEVCKSSRLDEKME